MSERKKQIEAIKQAAVVADVVAEQVDNAIDWKKFIRECGDDLTLETLLKTMPESAQLEHAELIDAQFSLIS